MTCLVFFFVTFCNGIGVLVTYTAFPKKLCNGDELDEADESNSFYNWLIAASKWERRKKVLLGLQTVNFLFYVWLAALGVYDIATDTQYGVVWLERESKLP